MAHERISNEFAKGGRFRKIAGGLEAKTLVAVVPGVGTPPPEEWTDSNGRLWLQMITDDTGPDVAVFAYDHRQIPEENFSWQGLIDMGNAFSVDLVELRSAENLSNCPLVIVSHSLGGILVKQSLCQANERSFQFRSLFRALAGLIFFGTPHSISEEERNWQNAMYAMRPAGTIRKKNPIARDDARMLGSASLRFEQSMNAIPILAIYETRLTKVRYSFLSSDKMLLVGKSSVGTNTTREEFVALEADHRRLCNVQTSSKGFERICSFFRVNIESARSRIQRGSPEYQAPSALDHLTVRSRSSKDSLSRPNLSPNLGPPSYDKKKTDTRHQSISTQATQRATANSSESATFEIIPSVSNFSSSKKDPKLPCHLIPFSRNRDFFGRSEVLQAIDHVFCQPSNDTADTVVSRHELRAYAICGPGGIGKTQTAIEYASSRKDRFEAILWVYADQAEKLAEGFSHIAVAMGLVPENTADAKDQILTRELVRGWLANPRKTYQDLDKSMPESAAWLLVFDNVDDPDLLTEFWPPDGPGCVLVTSRDPLTKKNGFSTITGIDLEPFTYKEGAELLLRLTGRETHSGDKSSSVDVAEHLGGFPLAITQMAGVITRLDLTFAEFLRTYDEEESRAELLGLQLQHPSHRTGYEHTVASAWAIESLHLGAVLLDLLSLFDPDGIQERIFTQTPHIISLERFPQTSAAYQRARSELFRSSLVTRDVTKKKLTIHRLVQDTVRSKMSNERFCATFSAAVTLLCSVWPFDNSNWQHGVARWAICEDLFPHILRLRKFYARFRPLEGNGEAKYQFARLLNDAGWYHLERGHPAESEAFYELAEALCSSLKADPTSFATMDLEGAFRTNRVDELLADVYHHSGCAATATNKPANALSRFQTLNSIMLAEVNAGSEAKKSGLAISWNELGIAYMMNRQWVEGEDCFLRSIGISKQLANFTKTMISFPMVNLGLAYWLTNRYEESAQVLSEGLEDREAAFGVNDQVSFITGRFLHALGNVKGSQGLLDESFAYHQRALIQYKSTVGNNHHRTAAMCYKVANHYIRKQQNDGALKLLDQALKVYGDRPEYTPEKARASFLKGRLLTMLQDPERGRAALEQSFELYRSCVGKGKDLGRDPSTTDFEDLVIFWSK